MVLKHIKLVLGTYVNVFSPGHGLTSGTTQRFRGQPTTSPGTGTSTNPVFAFANPGDFDGILGSNK